MGKLRLREKIIFPQSDDDKSSAKVRGTDPVVYSHSQKFMKHFPSSYSARICHVSSVPQSVSSTKKRPTLRNLILLEIVI